MLVVFFSTSSSTLTINEGSNSQISPRTRENRLSVNNEYRYQGRARSMLNFENRPRIHIGNAIVIGSGEEGWVGSCWMVRSGYKRQRNKKGMREGKKWRKRERENLQSLERGRKTRGIKKDWQRTRIPILGPPRRCKRDCRFARCLPAAPSSVKNTSAKPGVGTSMVHVCAVVSHCTVLMSSVPVERPSDSKLPPNVCVLRR
jgi:hypothetical protein